LLFGAATDSAMAKSLSVTIISALPEERLQVTSSQTVQNESKDDQKQNASQPEVVENLEANDAEQSELTEEGDQVDQSSGSEDAEEISIEAELGPQEGFADQDGASLDEEETHDQGVGEEPEVEQPVVETVIDEPAAEDETPTNQEDVELPLAAKLPEKRSPDNQGELSLEGGPRGRFEGEQPNVIKGEDLDVPPYLRRKGRRR